MFAQIKKDAKTENPNLSGFWVLVNSTRNPSKLTNADKMPIILVITQNNPELSSPFFKFFNKLSVYF